MSQGLLNQKFRFFNELHKEKKRKMAAIIVKLKILKIGKKLSYY